MERGPGLAFLFFLLTVSGLFSHPLSDQEIEYSTVSVSVRSAVLFCATFNAIRKRD